MCWGLIGPRQIIALNFFVMWLHLQPHNKKFKCFFNYKLTVRTGLVDPENIGKDIKTDFLSQILKKLWGMESLLLVWLTRPFPFLLI